MSTLMIDVKFSWHHGSQNEVVSYFSKELCPSMTYLKLDFDFCYWLGAMDFKEFCVELQEKCPHIQTLILNNALLSVSFHSAISICSEFLQNVKTLVLHKSEFNKGSEKRECCGISVIEILDISECADVEKSSMHIFSTMPYFKKLNLSGIEITDYWFRNEDNLFFLHQLESLHRGDTDICHETLRVLQKYAVNLTELYLCWTRLSDDDFNRTSSAFPLLKTICLKSCRHLTCEGIVSLVQSCSLSLENVYVDRHIAQSYALHPFVTANKSKLEIVKAIDNCDNHEKLEFLLD